MKRTSLKKRKRAAPLPVGLIIKNRAEVRSYLRRHPEFDPTVPAVVQRAREEFGDEAELELEVYHDPEIDDHFLILYIRLSRYDAEVMQRIDALWSTCVENALLKSEGWFSVTTDFRKLKARNGV
jgi:hypothetical protein